MPRWVKAIAIVASLVVVAFLGVVAAYFYFLRHMDAPGPLAAPTTVIIPKGEGAEAVAMALTDAGVVESPYHFLLAGKLTGELRALKAGEYTIPAGASLIDVLALLREGRTVVHKVTIPEGLTSAQVMALVTDADALSGPVPPTPPEGTLFPDTYHYARGDTRVALVSRMTRKMETVLAEAWAKRDEGLPYADPAQALVMASVVEKETGLADERGRVAGVFVNRLRTGMRLQSDPTVVYGLTGGSGELGRALTRADWKHESPYNTYVIDGLPPKPIANPGRAAIEAALHPDKHDFLYFVADGGGGHTFSKTLNEHNRAVSRRAADR